jgi:holliday junction DNA helicase RuvA
MIARLRGKAAVVGSDGIVIDVAGVGYLVQPTRRLAQKARARGEVTVETYLHVREDVLQLYGFADVAEREMFEHLLSVSGVGPKVALAIVSGSKPEELRRAIALDDTARFQAIPGIGKKTAQRVVLELKERLGDPGSGGGAAERSGAPQLVARAALVELGYSVVEADQALAEVDPDLSPEERVRLVLRRAA